MDAFQASLQARRQAAETATFGDYARSAGASVFDVAGAIPSLVSYGASQSDDPLAQDIEYIGQSLADGLFELGDDIRGANTPAAQRIMSARVGDETFWQHPFAFVGLNMANTAAPIAAGIAGAIVAGPTVGMLINSGIAGVHSAGITYNDMVKDLDAQNLDSNALYQSLVAEGRSPQEARREFKRLAISYKPAALAVVTAIMARYSPSGQIISKMTPGASAAAQGLVRRVGTGAALAGGEEAAQNTLEELASQSTRVDTGLQEGYEDQRLIEAAITGGLVGSVFGAAAGAPRGRGALPLDEPERVEPPSTFETNFRPEGPTTPATIAPVWEPATGPTSGGATTVTTPPPPRSRRKPPTAPAPTPEGGPAPTPTVPGLDPDITAALAASEAPPAGKAPEPPVSAAGAAAGGAEASVAPLPSAEATPAATPAARRPRRVPPVAPVAPVAEAPVEAIAPEAIPVDDALTAKYRQQLIDEFEVDPAEVAAMAPQEVAEAIDTFEATIAYPGAAATEEVPTEEAPVEEELVEEAPLTSESNAEDPRVQTDMQQFVTNLLAMNNGSPPTAFQQELIAERLAELQAEYGQVPTEIVPATTAEPIVETPAAKPKGKKRTPKAPAPVEDNARAQLETDVAAYRSSLEESGSKPASIERAVNTYREREAKKRGIPSEPPAEEAAPATEPEAEEEPEVVPFPSEEMRAELDRQTPAAREIISIGKRRKKPKKTTLTAATGKIVEKVRSKRKSAKPEKLPIATAKKPEPKAPEPKRQPAAMYNDEWFVGDTPRAARETLQAQYEPDEQGNPQPADEDIIEGFDVDGEFRQIWEVADTEGAPAANKAQTERNIAAMELAQKKMRRASDEIAGVESAPEDTEPTARDTNRVRNEMIGRVATAARNIFKNHAYRKKPKGYKGTDLQYLQERVAGIVKEANIVEKTLRGIDEKAGVGKLARFEFGLRAREKRLGAHTWLVRAKQLDRLWKGNLPPSPKKIDGFLNDEMQLKAEYKAGNVKADPGLERSRIEAGFKMPKGFEGGETSEGGVTAAELVDEPVEEEEIVRAQEDFTESGIPMPFSPDFERERRVYRLPNKAKPIDQSMRGAGRNPKFRVELKAGGQWVDIPRTLANANAARSALKTLRDRLTKEGRKVPEWMKTKAAKAPLTAKQKARLREEMEAENQRIAEEQRARTEQIGAPPTPLSAEEQAKRRKSLTKATAAAKAKADKRLAAAKEKVRKAQEEAGESPEALAAQFAAAQQARSAEVTPQRGKAAMAGYAPAPPKKRGRKKAAPPAVVEDTVTSQSQSASEKKQRQQLSDLWEVARREVAQAPRKPHRRSLDEVPDAPGVDLAEGEIDPDALLQLDEETVPESDLDVEPPAAKKAPKFTEQEALRREEKGAASGWLKSPYVKGREFARVIRTMSARDALNEIDPTTAAKGVKGRRASLAFLKNRLIKAVGDTKIYVVSAADLRDFIGDNYSATANQQYDGIFVHFKEGRPGGNYIVLNEDLYNFDDRRVAESVMHEIVHAATIAGIKADPRLGNYLNNLMQEVMKHHGIEDPSAHYGFNDVLEFVAEAMTNPEFQELLAGTPLSKSMQAKLGITSVDQVNGWQAFLNFIVKAFRLPKDTLSVLHAVVHVTEGTMADTRSGGGRVDESVSSPIPKISPKALARGAVTDIRDYYSREGRQESMRVPWALKLADLSQLARSSDRFWNHKNSAVRKVYRLLTNIAEQTNLNMIASEKLIKMSVDAEKKAGQALWTRFAQLLNDETNFNVYADRPLAAQTHLGKNPEGKPTLKGVQARAKHAALSAEYVAIAREASYLVKLRNEMHSFMRKRQRLMSHYLVHNMLVEGLRGEVAAKDISDALVTRIIDKKLTDADKKFIGNNDLVLRIVRAKELYNMEGPYFPLMRRGKWVVRAKLKVKPPAAALNGTLKEGTDNIYEFRGKDARDRAMKYAAQQQEKAWVSGTTIDEKTGESWEELPDGSELPGSRRKITMKDADAIRVFSTEVMNDHVEFFDSEAAADRAAFELETEDDIEPGSVKGVQERRWSPGDRGVEILSSDLSLLMRALERRKGYKDMPADMQRQLRLSIQEFGLQMMGSTRVHKRRIARRNVSGAALDPTRNLIDYAQSTSSYTARLEFAQEIMTRCARARSRSTREPVPEPRDGGRFGTRSSVGSTVAMASIRATSSTRPSCRG